MSRSDPDSPDLAVGEALVFASSLPDAIIDIIGGISDPSETARAPSKVHFRG
jgi:hypothetical protein